MALFDACQSLFRSAPQSEQQDAKSRTPVTPSVGFQPIPELGSAISGAVVDAGLSLVLGLALFAAWGILGEHHASCEWAAQRVVVKMEDGN
jgi:hypothetical protein